MIIITIHLIFLLMMMCGVYSFFFFPSHWMEWNHIFGKTLMASSVVRDKDGT